MSYRFRITGRAAFTLVELLVVIAIIGILSAALFPAVVNMRENARRAQCSNHLLQLGLGFQDHVAGKQRFPAGVIDDQGPIVNQAKGIHRSWTIAMLPYLDENALFDHIQPNISVYDPQHQQVRQTYPRVYRCPSASVSSMAYAGVHHDQEASIDVDQNGILFLNSAIGRADIPDGRGYTLLVGERLNFDDDLGWMSGTRATLRNAGHPLQTAPPEADAPPPSNVFVGGFGSPHPQVCGFLFADGHSRYLDVLIETAVLQQLAHRADGALIDPVMIE